MSSANDKTQDGHLAGYSQVIEIEQKEEERVRAALATIAEEQERLTDEGAERLRMAEMKAKADAGEELKNYKDQELARIVSEGEAQTDAHLKAIDTRYKKQSPALVTSLTEKLLDPSFAH